MFFGDNMASGSVSESGVLSERFLEQFEIRSEVYGDDQDIDPDRKDGESVDWDLLDRRFSNDPGFREWVSKKAAGSGAHLGKKHSHSSVSMSSGKNHILQSGTTSLLRAGRETSTLKPLIDRPLQKRLSHNFPGCSHRSSHLTSCLGRATNTVIGIVFHVIPF